MRVTTSVCGHYKTGGCLGKQLRWGPGQSCQKHSWSSLGLYCCLTPDPAPLEGFVHSWTLQRLTPHPTESQLFGSALAGKHSELLRVEK